MRLMLKNLLFIFFLVADYNRAFVRECPFCRDDAVWKKRSNYPDLLQTEILANITKCDFPDGTHATKPCDYACVEVKVEPRRSSIPLYYRDCGEGLLKRAPCRECWPNATEADYSLVTSNVTTFDYDKHGEKWTFKFCAANNCTDVFHSKATTLDPQRMFVFIGVFLEIVLVAILVKTAYVLNRGNCSSRSREGSRGRTRSSSTPSEPGTMLRGGNRTLPSSRPSDRPQMIEYFSVREAAEPDNFQMTSSISSSVSSTPPVTLELPPIKDETSYVHSSTSENNTNNTTNDVNDNETDVEMNKEMTPTAPGQLEISA